MSDFTPLERMRITKYQESIFKFGVLAIAYLITEYEEQENYRECEVLLFSLLQHNKAFNQDTPTRIDENSIEWAKKEFWNVSKTNGSSAIFNTPEYAQSIKDLVKNLFWL
jgi:hypothetical protein